MGGQPHGLILTFRGCLALAAVILACPRDHCCSCCYGTLHSQRSPSLALFPLDPASHHLLLLLPSPVLSLSLAYRDPGLFTSVLRQWRYPENCRPSASHLCLASPMSHQYPASHMHPVSCLHPASHHHLASLCLAVHHYPVSHRLLHFMTLSLPLTFWLCLLSIFLLLRVVTELARHYTVRAGLPLGPPLMLHMARVFPRILLSSCILY